MAVTRDLPWQAEFRQFARAASWRGFRPRTLRPRPDSALAATLVGFLQGAGRFRSVSCVEWRRRPCSSGLFLFEFLSG